MVKIIGILAIVLVCYCEIHAEIDNLQNGKSTTEDARKRFTVTTKKTWLAANISDVKPNQTNKAQLRAKFATEFPEDYNGPLIKFIIKIGEAPYNDLEQQLAETRGSNQIHIDENQNEKKDGESNKPKKKSNHRRRSGKHIDKEKVDYKDNYEHQMLKKRNKEEEENEEKDSERKKPKKKKSHHHNSKNHDNIDYKDRKHQNDKKHDKVVDENEEKESESNKPKKKKKHHHHSRNREEIDFKDGKHQNDKKLNIAIEENEEKGSESNEPKNNKNHHSENREDMKETDYTDRKHKKDKKHDKAVDENEKKESESNKPKKKKKHHHHSRNREEIDFKGRKHQNDKKLNKAIKENEEKGSESNEPKNNKNHHSENREDMKETDYKDRKHKKDKKRNKEGNNAVKWNELRNSLEKDDKHTEKSIGLDNDTTTKNTTRPYQSLVSGMSQEIKKITFKGSKKEQTAADKEDKMLANVGATALQLQSMAMASNKDPKLQTKPAQMGIVNRTLFKNTVALRTLKKKHEKELRATRMVPLSLNKLYDKEMKKRQSYVIRQGDKNEKQKNPSLLSPYAIMAQMEELMKEFPDVNATITKHARTVEYNDIVLVTITAKNESAERYLRAKESKYAEDVPEKKIIFIVHGLTVMGMKGLKSLVQMSELKLLLSYYFKHLDKFDIYLMPLANPDGYSASRSSDRTIWNKNVSPQSECPGVFVDRNFDIAWNESREISSCSQLYPGAKPFSEVESKAVRDVFHRYSHKILAYIHVHSGTFDENVFKGDAILYPRGYTEMQSDDDKYIDLKGEIDEAMKNASFRVISVTVDTLANWYGVVAGTSVDYASAVFGVPYAFEFVMQIYNTANLNNNALTEIWSRLVDTTFNNIWKSLHHASAERT